MRFRMIETGGCGDAIIPPAYLLGRLLFPSIVADASAMEKALEKFSRHSLYPNLSQCTNCLPGGPRGTSRDAGH